MRTRYIQDRVTHELIPINEYVQPVENKSALIMPDISPYKSMIDGSIINSRSKHRVHLRDHGCIEVGNEMPKPRKPVELPPVKEDLLRAAYQAGVTGSGRAFK